VIRILRNLADTSARGIALHPTALRYNVEIVGSKILRPSADPHLSPIYGDFHGFPPTVLTSGTRDLLLSLTVLTHRKLRRSNVEAELNVFKGMSHISFILNPYAPESREVFTDWARFFDKHLVH
jgi:acetyl esterase/lipase